MRPYRYGRRKEYETIELLEKDGYECVRAAGSHGKWDVIAWNRDTVLFIQVKYGRNISKKEREVLAKTPVPKCAQKMVLYWPRRQSQPELIFIHSEEKREDGTT